MVLVLLLAGAAAWLVMAPYGPSSENFVEIAPRTTTAKIAEQLQQAGIVRSALAFEAYRLVEKGSLKAGEYRFDHPATMAEVYERLRRGDVYTRTVVIPEGYDLFQVAEAVQAAGLGSAQAFLAAAQSQTELVRSWSPSAPSLEGFLFPDTYRFSRHATPEEMLAAMVKRFGQVAQKLQLEPGNAARIVTLASLVEREVHVPQERAAVAGVFENRLALGMPLQTDPSVAYASELRGTWTGVIHQSELHSDSAYNTYTHSGLPPGPICNPGLNALTAALHPQQNQYLYFVSDAAGHTTFAQTLAEHQKNVAVYRSRTR